MAIHREIMYLVADTIAFIRNLPLQNFARYISTEEDVIHEVKNKTQLKSLAVLPYKLSIETADPENIKFVTEFAKKTGDYFNLSATDIKVIALTYQLEKSLAGISHLRTEPIKPITLSYTLKKSDNHNESLAGFYMPETEKDTNKKDMSTTISTTMEKLNINVEKYSDYEDDTDDQDDDSGWITPGNICNMQKKHNSVTLYHGTNTLVACLTSDFAMQNVLKQIGLQVVALDGTEIRHLRTFILRCYACYKTTKIMTKVFCPTCGNKTLKKVSVSFNEEGKQTIHINPRRPISKKGKRFSLPMPKGGKHANNPILCEDQPVPDQRPTRLARTKNDPLQDDYIAGYSPFIMRDVYSKSAILRSGRSVKYWMKKNPNEVKRSK